MPTTKAPVIHEFTVSGVGMIPVDMLRYDRCWPATERESAAIEQLSRRRAEPGTVKMHGLNPPTGGRWASFGWTVIA